MKVIVRTPNRETEFEAAPKTTGRELYQTMCKSLGIQETWWFGVSYNGAEAEDIWIDKSKKNLKTLEKVVTNLQFNVKYYPEDIDELIESITIEYFFLQIKSLILKNEIYCPADTCVLLASYVLQVNYGDYNKEKINEDLIKQKQYLPERVIKQHDMDVSQWENSIINMWIKHKGLDQEEAMLEYLKLVQNLEMYGVTYFQIKNTKGTELLLGVTALGLNIYKTEDRLNPSISFPWSEIKHLKYRGTKFTIQPADKTAKNFVIITSNEKVSKIILNLGIGNHELYGRRRRPDPPEIIQMKEKSNAVRKSKVLIRQKYNTERLAREDAERRETMYKKQLDDMKIEMERKHATLLEAERTIKKLQEQLDDLQQTKEELEIQKRELQELTLKLEESKNMEMAEKMKLVEEIQAKHDEVERIQNEVVLKDEESKKLQEQIEEARRREEELLKQQEEERLQELERRRREIEEIDARGKELESLPDADNTLPDVTEVNDQLKEQLKHLQDQLSNTKKPEELTELDRIHMANLLEGRNKFKTLRDIRKGNTSRRVELFENL